MKALRRKLRWGNARMVEARIATPAALSLKGRLGFLLKDAVLYGGAAAISKAFALITFPLLARHFSVAEYGVLDYYIVLAGFLATFVIFGQDNAVARFFYEHEETVERRQLITQSLLFQLVGLALFVPVLWFGAGWLTTLLIDAPDRVFLFKIVLLQLPFLVLINFSQNLLKWTFSRARFLTMSLGFTVEQTSLLVIAVLVFDVGLQGVLLVGLITSALFGALGLFFVRQWLTRPKDFRHLRICSPPFAIPYGVICVAAAFSPALERTLTDTLLGERNWVCMPATNIGEAPIGLLVSAFQTAWGPFSLSLYKQADAGHTYNWVLKLFALGMCIAALILTLLAPPLIHFLATDRYSGAAIVVFPLAMGLAIQATSWITEIGIGISKRSYLNLYAYAIAVVATLGGILLLVPRLGLLGVGLGVMIGHASKALISSWLAQRAHPLPWRYTPVVAVFGLTLLLGLAAIEAGQEWGYRAHSFSLVLALFVVLAAGWRILFDRSDRTRIMEALRGRFRRIRSLP